MINRNNRLINTDPGKLTFTRVFSLSLFLLFPFISIVSQEPEVLSVDRIYKLDKTLSEISGITFLDGNVYALNDSGNGNYVYRLDNDNFDIKERYRIKKAFNRDWEELSSYDNKLYIGNFGNNYGQRDDLSLYRFKVYDLKKEKLKIKEIPFSYKYQRNQKSIPYKHKWDCEAMIVNEKGIWLFSKDWDDRTCKLYNLSDKDSIQSLVHIDEIKLDFLVTGAFYSKKDELIYLCGYENELTFLMLIESGDEISLKGRSKKYLIPELENRQVESIFVRDEKVYLASERTEYKQAIYMIKLPTNQTDEK